MHSNIKGKWIFKEATTDNAEGLAIVADVEALK